MTVVSFVDYQPPARYDATSWRQVEIYEAEDSAGPWTLIDTILFPADPNPADPQLRSFSTTNGTGSDLWYRIRFRDLGAGVSDYTAPIWNVTFEQPYVPSITDVADLLPARTVGPSGAELGTFTDDTRPKAIEVEGLIRKSVGLIFDRIGNDPPLELAEPIKTLTALQAAMLVELTYYPEQVYTNRSPYAQLKELFDDNIAALIAAIEAHDEDEVPGLPAGMPRFGFPSSENMIGLETSW